MKTRMLAVAALLTVPSVASADSGAITNVHALDGGEVASARRAAPGATLLLIGSFNSAANEWRQERAFAGRYALWEDVAAPELTVHRAISDRHAVR